MMKLMPVNLFVEQLVAAYERKDGYIMCATGQNPKKWAVTSWWFTQYTNAKQHAKALYWREHAERVWDCNGMAEGLYKDFSGVSINTQARYNYKDWCDPKGAGMIPEKYRVPGAAVFWGSSAGNIHHVAYLIEPVNEGHPEGDWYLIEARGVMYGVVKTRLHERKPDFWGWMSKYFDYAADAESKHLGWREMRNGDEGEDVRELQSDLIRLGYDCGKWGADGEFGDATEMAVIAFQCHEHLDPDGIAGSKTIAALEKALAEIGKQPDNPLHVRIEGGACYIRSAPNTNGNILGAVIAGTVLPFGGERSENGWLLVDWKNKNGWVSGKYGRLTE